MQGRETLGKRRAGKFGVGEGTCFWGLLIWRDNVWVVFPSPWAFLLVLPMLCPTESASFLSKAFFQYFSFTWIFFSRVHSQLCAHRVPLLISRAAPEALGGSGHIMRREEPGLTCSSGLKARSELQPRCQSFLPRFWLLPSSLKEHTGFFFSS